MLNDLDLAAMLSSRLCHDLVGPVGAIANGLEILEEDQSGEMRDQALALLNHSAREATQRLEFYRMAFGAPGGLEATVSCEEVRRVVCALYETGKVELDCRLPDGALNQTGVRMLLNLILIAAECLPRGGSVTVNVERVEGGGPDGLDIAIVAKGQDAALKEDTETLLSDQAGSVSAHTVQAYYTKRLADELGADILYDATQDGRVNFRTTLGKRHDA